MAVTSVDLLAPVGELHLALFPMRTALEVAAQLDAYIAVGYANATAAGFTDPARLDQIATAFAYWRARSEVLDRVTSNPTTSAFVDKGSSSYSSKQLEIMADRAGEWKAQYETLMIPDTVSETRYTIPGGSQFATFRY